MYLIHNTTVLLLSVLHKAMPHPNVPFCKLIYAKTSKVVDIFLYFLKNLNYLFFNL